MCAFFFASTDIDGAYCVGCPFTRERTMNLQQLRFVCETVRRNFSLTQAAQALGTSQPAVSRGILELEAELGVDVFVRRGKRLLGLTDPGRAVLSRAERVLAEIAGIEQVTADWRSRDTGELRIATTHTQARYSLPAVIREFRRRYPAVRLSLQQGSPRQIVELLLAREVDVGIATELPTDVEQLQVIPAFEWEHVVLAPHGHPILQHESLSLEGLAEHPLVTYVPGFAGRGRIDAAFEHAGLTPEVVLSAIDSDVIKTYVGVGLGVGIVAAPAWDPVRDRSLDARPAGALFGPNQVKLAVRRDGLLRGFALTFVELYAPGTDRKMLQTATDSIQGTRT